jgi:hypothetical protein
VGQGTSESEAATIAQRIIGRIHKLPDPAMRVAVLAERLRRLPAAGAVDVMSAMVELIRPGNLPSTLAMHALSEVLGEKGPIDYERRADWYRQARHLNHDALALMILPREAKLKPPKLHAASDPVAAYLKRQVPLGEKRSLARGKDKDLLERLLFDPNPLVLRNLLGNPTLTEEWVLRVATRRPVAPDILHEVTQSRRWFGRYKVRLAVARNPYTPTDLAIRSVPELQVPDLKDMVTDGSLHEDVRRAASEELARRRPVQKRKRKTPASDAGEPSGGVGTRGRRSASGIRGAPVTEGFGRVGGDVDLVLAGEGLLEVPDALAHGVAELRDLCGPEDQDHDGQDDEQLRAAEAEGEGQLVHRATVSPDLSEHQNEDVVQGVGPDRDGERPGGVETGK